MYMYLVELHDTPEKIGFFYMCYLLMISGSQVLPYVIGEGITSPRFKSLTRRPLFILILHED